MIKQPKILLQYYKTKLSLITTIFGRKKYKYLYSSFNKCKIHYNTAQLNDSS